MRIDVRCGAPEIRSDPCLVVIYGPDLGLRLPLGDTPILIGRGADNDVVVPLEAVSREHCRIDPTSEGYEVRDLDSTNGTFVDDFPVKPDVPRPLASGVRIQMGGVILKFLAGSDVEALYHEEIYRLTIMDGLTKLYNRRYAIDFLEREMARCRRHGSPLSIVLFDLDHFKAINDTHGHLAGDDFLRQLSAALLGSTRREVCLARLSGEEFVAVLPDTDADGARLYAERLRGITEHASFEVDGALAQITLSAGIARMTAGMVEPTDFLRVADARLYEAKDAGRNCVAG